MPTTRSTLAADVARLGVESGATLLVHSSLKAVGWVVGGPVAVVQALLDAVGPAGTIVVPTQNGEYSDPAQWVNPPVPEAWWPVIRSEMPAFDPRLTPSRRMGIVAETVRTWPRAAERSPGRLVRRDRRARGRDNSRARARVRTGRSLAARRAVPARRAGAADRGRLRPRDRVPPGADP